MWAEIVILLSILLSYFCFQQVQQKFTHHSYIASSMRLPKTMLEHLIAEFSHSLYLWKLFRFSILIASGVFYIVAWQKEDITGLSFPLLSFPFSISTYVCAHLSPRSATASRALISPISFKDQAKWKMPWDTLYVRHMRQCFQTKQ